MPTEEKHKRFLEQAETEFSVAKLFRHPSLRKCYDLKIRKKLFGGVIEAGLVMEMVDGVTLEENCPPQVAKILDIFAKVGVALGAVHHLRLVHCDLKPNNILLLPEGRIKLIDFGQTVAEGTVKNRVQGTPDFIAPEQVRLRPVRYYTDVYNYGASIYWALSGQRVPTLLTIKKGEKDIVKEQKFPWPHHLNPAVPEPISELIMDCLRVSPAYRPQTIGEVLQRLEPFLPKNGASSAAIG